MGLFSRGKTFSFEKAKKMINSGEYDNYHFEPIETKDGILTGEYRAIIIQKNIKKEDDFER